jgi:hypothetical protein
MLGWILGLACLAFAVWGHMGPHAEPYHRSAKAAARPVAASDGGAWLLLPFQLVAGLAALCWCLLGLLVFLSPLLILAAVVWGVLQ